MAAVAEQSSGVNSKHFFAIAISCGRLERAGAVMNSENLKNSSDYDSNESCHKHVLRMQKSIVIGKSAVLSRREIKADVEWRMPF